MFDLNAKNVLKFKDMKYFVHIITKMAKLLEPVVLFLDGAHKPFYKKVNLQSILTVFKNNLYF